MEIGTGLRTGVRGPNVKVYVHQARTQGLNVQYCFDYEYSITI